MAENQGEYCVIYRESGKWTRAFFESKVLADEFMSKQHQEARAFLRQHVVVSVGSKSFFDSESMAKANAQKVGGQVTVLNPMISDLPAELLYT